MDLSDVHGLWTGLGIGSFFTYFFKRFLDKTVVEFSLYRDLGLDILWTVNQLRLYERALEQRPTYSKPDDLVGQDSAWLILPPAIGLDRILVTSSSRRVHTLAIEYFDLHARAALASDEHKIAFYWLLDNPDLWDKPAGLERREVLKVGRADINKWAVGMTAKGYELALACIDCSEKLPQVTHATQRPLRGFLEDKCQIRFEHLEEQVKDYTTKFAGLKQH